MYARLLALTLTVGQIESWPNPYCFVSEHLPNNGEHGIANWDCEGNTRSPKDATLSTQYAALIVTCTTGRSVRTLCVSGLSSSSLAN